MNTLHTSSSSSSSSFYSLAHDTQIEYLYSPYKMVAIYNRNAKQIINNYFFVWCEPSVFGMITHHEGRNFQRSPATLTQKAESRQSNRTRCRSQTLPLDLPLSSEASGDVARSFKGESYERTKYTSMLRSVQTCVCPCRQLVCWLITADAWGTAVTEESIRTDVVLLVTEPVRKVRIIIITRKCTLWRCKSTPTPKAKLLWMTSHYGPTVVRSVTEIPFHVLIW